MTKIEIRQEIEPLVNVPLSVIVSGLLTLLAYVVAESFHRPEEATGPASLGHNTLAVAIALFLIGFLHDGKPAQGPDAGAGPAVPGKRHLFLAAISLTYRDAADCRGRHFL